MAGNNKRSLKLFDDLVWRMENTFGNFVVCRAARKSGVCSFFFGAFTSFGDELSRSFQAKRFSHWWHVFILGSLFAETKNATERLENIDFRFALKRSGYISTNCHVNSSLSVMRFPGNSLINSEAGSMKEANESSTG